MTRKTFKTEEDFNLNLIELAVAAFRHARVARAVEELTDSRRPQDVEAGTVGVPRAEPKTLRLGRNVRVSWNVPEPEACERILK